MAKFGYQVLGFGSSAAGGGLGPGVWSEQSNAMNVGRSRAFMGAVSRTAVVIGMGRVDPSNATTTSIETWNGSATTESATSSFSYYGTASSGTGSSALIAGGANNSYQAQNDTQEWTGGDTMTNQSQTLGQDAENANACGPSANDCYFFGGNSIVNGEYWGGSSWSTSGDRPDAPRNLYAAHTAGNSSSDCITTGGYYNTTATSDNSSSRSFQAQTWVFTGTWSASSDHPDIGEAMLAGGAFGTGSSLATSQNGNDGTDGSTFNWDGSAWAVGGTHGNSQYSSAGHNGGNGTGTGGAGGLFTGDYGKSNTTNDAAVYYFDR
tara:strand:+ start:120 stop:1082 length:963 start_codon:yes stop_codon:yes gene_type:complete